MDQNNLNEIEQEEISETVQTNAEETLDKQESAFETNEPAPEKSKKQNPINWICISILTIAVIVLYVLHFIGNKKQNDPIVYTSAENAVPGSGEVVYINIDTINKYYKLVDILTNDIDAERSKQEAIFANRQKAFENKYAQFQQNYQANILTPVQVQNSQQQLMQESETLQYEYEQVINNLQNRQMAALQQIADSLMAASRQVNATRNASFVFSYQYGGQLILADPTKDITNEVLNELNKHYQ
jgi:Outer membrane protein